MTYMFIVVSILLQYHHNNRIGSCCNYHSEHFRYRPTLPEANNQTHEKIDLKY